MATKKLYWHYLKKVLWRSWRVWYIILFSWIWWAVLGWGFSKVLTFSLETNDSGRENEQLSSLASHVFSYRGLWLGNEESLKWIEKNIDKLNHLTPEEKTFAKEVAQNFSRSFEGLTYEERERKVRKYFEDNFNKIEQWTKIFGKADVDSETEEERWKCRYSYWGNLMNFGLPFRIPYDYNLVEFASPKGQKEIGLYQLWGLINNISIWNFAGGMVSMFFVYTMLDKLFFDTKKNGEDAMIVNFTPGVKRSQIFFSKVLAYITALAVYVLLACILPYGILIGLSTGLTFFPWLNFLWLTLYSTIIGSLCFTLIAGGIYLFLNTLGTFGRILQWLISYLPLIYITFMFMGKTVNKTLAYIQYYYYQPIFHLGLAAGLGILLFWLYLSYYKNEDLD